MDDKEAKNLLSQYSNIIRMLRELGVIRSGKVVSDYGEYIVCKKLGLKLVDSPVNKGYDAVDDNGVKFEIKSRKATAWNKPTIFPIKKEQLENFDFVIYVEFDDDWNIVKLLKIPSNEVRPNKYNRVPLTKSLVSRFSILDT